MNSNPVVEIAELLYTSNLKVLRTRHRLVAAGLDIAQFELPRGVGSNGQRRLRLCLQRTSRHFGPIDPCVSSEHPEATVIKINSQNCFYYAIESLHGSE